VKHIDRDAFARAFGQTGNIEKARLAAGYSRQQARKGRAGLPKDLLAVVNDTGALEQTEVPATVTPTVPALVAEPNPLLLGNRFHPGVSGNPSGAGAEGYRRTRSIREAFNRILDSAGADQFCQQIAHDALNATKPAERLAAFQEIADRTEGRSVQAHVVQGEIDQNTLRVLAELVERIFPERQPQSPSS